MQDEIYKVQLENIFEGPMDLLVHLIKKIPPSGRISFPKFNYENHFAGALKTYQYMTMLLKIF